MRSSTLSLQAARVLAPTRSQAQRCGWALGDGASWDLWCWNHWGSVGMVPAGVCVIATGRGCQLERRLGVDGSDTRHAGRGAFPWACFGDLQLRHQVVDSAAIRQPSPWGHCQSPTPLPTPAAAGAGPGPAGMDDESGSGASFGGPRLGASGRHRRVARSVSNLRTGAMEKGVAAPEENPVRAHARMHARGKALAQGSVALPGGLADHRTATCPGTSV